MVHSAQERVIPTELVARLEVASEGSDELDHAVSLATGILLTGVKENGEWGVKKGLWTQSLDAALALAGRVLPGWTTDVHTFDGSPETYPLRLEVIIDDEDKDCTVTLYYCHPRREPIEVSWGRSPASSPAIAVCAAVLKATTANSVGMSEANAPTPPVKTGEG